MSDPTDEEEIYDVEFIVKDRVVNGRKQYLIKWVGYDNEHNTWEDEDNILSAELKQEYEAAKQGKKKGRKAPAVAFEPAVTNEWGKRIAKVVAVFLNEERQLEAEYITHDGKKGIAPVAELHVKAPIKLLKFYESNINFAE